LGAPGTAAPKLTGWRSATTGSSVRAWLRRLVRELAIQDWIVLVYLTTLTLAVIATDDSPTRSSCLRHLAPLLGFCASGLVLVRGTLVRDGFFAPLTYRLAVYGTLQLSYFELRELLPLVNSSSLDRQLAFIDQHLLGIEPSLWLDQFVTPRTTEWFSFFYFGYFALLAVHVLPMVFISRRTKLAAEFCLGMILIYATSHTVYMLVPGFGPIRFFADQFVHPLPRGFWYDCVMSAVESGGAQKDIFPSLHTGGPAFLAIFSFRHRDKLPFRFTWPLVVFFVTNIIIATMFLRWHYLVDVIAGLAVAGSAAALAARFAPREVDWRAAQGLTPVWNPFTFRRSDLSPKSVGLAGRS
jgi:hypothetical protein